MSTKTPGEILYGLFNKLRGMLLQVPFADLDSVSRSEYEQAADDYDKARASLSEDVGAFVAEADARSVLIPRHDSETWEAFVAEVVTGHERVGGMVAEVVGFVGIESDAAAALSHAPNDVSRLIAIIRAQAAELAKCRSMFVSIVEWADGRTISQEIADREPLDRWIGEAGFRGQEVAKLRMERDALRERLAKLEKSGRDVVRVWLSDADWGPFVEALEVLESVLKVTENGMTETSEERKQ